MSDIIAGFSDLDLFGQIAPSLEKRIDANIPNGVDLLDRIVKSEYKIAILGDKLKDMSVYEFIVKLMKTKPLPCLIIYLEGKTKIEVDYPQAFDYAIVASLELAIKDGAIRFANLIMVRVNILSKLKIDRFSSQIEQINRAKKRIKYNDPETVDRIQRIRKSTTIKHIRRNKKNATESNVDTRSPTQIIVIGASTGGPKTLMYIISQFPAHFPPVLIVQHMPKGFVGAFAKRMNDNTNMNVKLGKDGDVIRNGCVYIAPGGYHMEVDNSTILKKIRITEGAKVNFVKPAVDVTLFSVARIFKDKIISVILTGMGSDGRAGTRLVKKQGGYCIALSQEQSIIYGMNKAVIDAGLADEIHGMDGIVIALGKIIKKMR